MATLTVTIPNPLIPDFVIIAERLLTARKIDFSGMTNIQKGQRYIVEVLKDDLIRFRKATAESSGQASVDAARNTAEANTLTTITTAVSDATGITG